MIGQTISHYKILEKLGERRMGVVYKAHDAPRGIRVFYVPDVYFKSKKETRAYLSDHALPPDVHASLDDTSKLLFIDHDRAWVRREKLASPDRDDSVPKGSVRASEELGKIFIEMKIKNAVDQIHRLLGKR